MGKAKRNLLNEICSVLNFPGMVITSGKDFLIINYIVFKYGSACRKFAKNLQFSEETLQKRQYDL